MSARYEIRELGLAEMLDTSFQLLRDRFWLLAGLAMIPYVPLSMVSGMLQGLAPALVVEPEQIEQWSLVAVAGIGLIVAITLVVMPFVACAITAALGRLYLGEQVDLGIAIRDGLRSYVPLVVTYFLFGLAFAFILGVTGLAAVPVIGVLTQSAEGGGSGVGAAVFVAGALLFTLWLALAIGVGLVWLLLPQVVILEGLWLWPAITRAWNLLEGHRWRVLGILICAWSITIIPVGGAQVFSLIQPLFGSFISGVAQSIANAFIVATTVVLYFDIRCRDEAFDLEHLARLVAARADGAEPTR